MKKPLIILTGPTAVGKTELSIKLAKAVAGEIISADSMQVYKHMDIGTAKIKPSDMQGVTHYLVDELEPEEDFNVVKFKEYALKYMEDIYKRGKLPILVGGTGFYIQAVLNRIDFKEAKEDNAYRDGLLKQAAEKGADYLHEQLKKVDPEAAKAIHPNNVKRVIRALEYHNQTGDLISAHNEEQKQKDSPYNFCYFVLNRDREVLYERINKRVDQMIEEGLVDEVKSLLNKGCTSNMVSMQGLGYKEIIRYLNGNCSLSEAINSIKQETRHFAKRQITWFKREKEVSWIQKEDYQEDEDILIALLSQIKDKGIIK
ncbi:tRNA (adenosine(37)-N6)-dimethylallyltransferase MiaA [Anaerocolumna sp. AGMB13020]|uniref:tRNA (adenosine(37)-N6)-dimethylallyltransferase MiaA n=1 Tax=Anaerocolumna sp. AGMB13020 TaxID=3081750 RepID=UPI00295417FF|nr:tRNA (adenosine(37)-N6)-dimethylallyltransferase MiaA [Anaerocolumna sp. AGMB13020]WOO36961.1 tRNA (adenosine(37)-N6)-dimethylallyltransferase MiaA [Anaerocolumna sp. AGMB13020]